ncbi:hypothetical protein PQR39_41510 [Paraburkholderia sediminicola]|uniref:hypothetical protein n=1 Tax=Paraburkholderia sediminicola TaxID=458836 RepID=UPI0038BA33FE
MIGARKVAPELREPDNVAQERRCLCVAGRVVDDALKQFDFGLRERELGTCLRRGASVARSFLVSTREPRLYKSLRELLPAKVGRFGNEDRAGKIWVSRGCLQFDNLNATDHNKVFRLQPPEEHQPTPESMLIVEIDVNFGKDIEIERHPD